MQTARIAGGLEARLRAAEAATEAAELRAVDADRAAREVRVRVRGKVRVRVGLGLGGNDILNRNKKRVCIFFLLQTITSFECLSLQSKTGIVGLVGVSTVSRLGWAAPKLTFVKRIIERAA